MFFFYKLLAMKRLIAICLPLLFVPLTAVGTEIVIDRNSKTLVDFSKCEEAIEEGVVFNSYAVGMTAQVRWAYHENKLYLAKLETYSRNNDRFKLLCEEFQPN